MSAAISKRVETLADPNTKPTIFLTTGWWLIVRILWRASIGIAEPDRCTGVLPVTIPTNQDKTDN